ncbi:MAG: hypothetical protein A2W19_13995 [Spirochaetes bacterium RBG_16_49_21]|nr:MAG: hypothetical protein A2W19_13995 [Spirochaetes bacterium RBG_16_49_21]
MHFNDLAEKEDKSSVNIIPYLNLNKGDVVADIGAGGGYFSCKLSEAVGESGMVYSVDISKESVDFIRKSVQEKGITNIEVVLATYDDSKLKPGTINLIFIRNAFHDIANRVNYFSMLRPVLKKNGRVVIIDYDSDKLGFLRNLIGHSLEEKVIRSEMKEAGYRDLRSYSFLQQQSFNIFAIKKVIKK